MENKVASKIENELEKTELEEVEEYDDVVFATDVRRYRYCITTARTIPTDNGGTHTVYDLGANKEASWPAIVHVLRDTDSRPNCKATDGLMPCHVGEGESRSGRTRGQKGRYRQAHLCGDLSMLILDIEGADWGTDDGDALSKQVQAAVGGACVAVYSSYNHGNPEKWKANHPRFRIVLPLSRDVTHDEHLALWTWANTVFAGVDQACKDASRVFYLPVPGPTSKKERKVPAWIIDLPGDLLDPDALPDGGTVAEWIETIDAGVKAEQSDLDVTLREKGLGPHDIQHMLAHIVGDGTYDQWIRVGFALWHTANVAHIVPDDVAYTAWEEWSKQDAIKTRDHKVDKAKWDSLASDKSNPCTMGTLIWMAQQGGWVLPRTWTAGSRLLPGTGDKDLADRVVDALTWRQDAFERYIYDTTDFGKQGPIPVKAHRVFPPDSVWGECESRIVFADNAIWHPNPTTGIWEVLTVDRVKAIMSSWNRKLMVAGKPKANGEVGDPVPYVYSDKSGSAVYNTLLAEAEASQTESPFDADCGYSAVRVANGTLVVGHKGEITGTLIFVPGPSPIGLYLRQAIPVEWVPTFQWGMGKTYNPIDFSAGDMPDERFRYWMQRWLVDSTADTVLEYVGACLMGHGSKIHKAILLQGPGGSGKSVMLSVFSDFFGSAVAHVEPAEMGDQFSLIDLQTARLNVSADIEKDELIKTGAIKRVLASDEVRADVKFKRAVNFRPNCGNLFSCNEFPASGDQSPGFWDRWIPIVWGDTENYRRNGEQITHLHNKILGQLGPAILRALIWGHLRFVNNGCDLSPLSPRTMQVLSDWQDSVDPMRRFVELRRVDNPNTYTLGSVLYDAYKIELDGNSRKPLSKDRFFGRLRQMGVNEKTKRGYAHFALRAFVPDSSDSHEEDGWAPLPN